MRPDRSPDAPGSHRDRSAAQARLPVVEAGTAFGGGVSGKLIGIVSRRDLLGVFLRPDDDIAGDVREMFTQLPQVDPGEVTVTVHNGIVTLTGSLGSAEEHDLIRVAGRLAWDLDGVVDVVNHLGTAEPVTSSAPGYGEMLLKPEEFLDVLGKPEELSGCWPGPGEFIAYDFAEHLLSSHRNFAVGMVEVTKPLSGGTEGTAAGWHAIGSPELISMLGMCTGGKACSCRDEALL